MESSTTRRGLLAGAAGLLGSVLAGCTGSTAPGAEAPGPVAAAPMEGASRLAKAQAPLGGGAGVAPSGVARNMLSRATALELEAAERDRYWLTARDMVHERVESLIRQHKGEQRRGVGHSKLMHGDPDRKWVALTFDDGPHPAYTPRLLDILREQRVAATFFLVGEMAEKHPDLVRRQAAEGHSIGNHTYHHVSLPKIPLPYVATEIKACGEILKSITGQAPRLFRPPGGQYTTPVAEISETLGYKMILWTDDPGDYASPGTAVIRKRTLEDLDNGGIILVHDGIEQTIQLLPDLVTEIRRRGYELVTVDEMIGRPPRVAA